MNIGDGDFYGYAAIGRYHRYGHSVGVYWEFDDCVRNMFMKTFIGLAKERDLSAGLTGWWSWEKKGTQIGLVFRGEGSPGGL